MNIDDYTELTNKINLVRKLMIVTAQTKGINNPETIKYSEELYRLILETQLLLKTKVNKPFNPPVNSYHLSTT
ncbi:aspartyl-phosphate phosphatase Spo0E family protein [uncultured Metabacillus sp.]|nr:aspartyl-phosphate phosphatase Spo0E family protein [uncultured Metabacillus sp.]